MSNVNAWDSIEAFQLKECYDLATQFEKLDTAKDVLRERSKKIDIPKNYVPVQADAAYEETEIVERHAMSKKGPETKKAEKSRENIKKAQFYVEFHAKPGDKLQKGA